MENLAERLFCDLRNRRIKLESPWYAVDGCKIGDGNSRQFVIFESDEKFTSSEGVGISATSPFNKTFTDAYNDLLNKVLSVGNHLKFYSLVIPKRGVIDVKLLEFEGVVGRYIKDYLPQTDQAISRWDFLVGPGKAE